MVNLFSSYTPWSSLLPCLIIFSLLSVLSFYIDSFGGQHIDACRVALLSSLIPFVTALGTSCLLVYYTKDSIDIHHGLSMGVVLAFILLFLATLFLTQSVRQSHGVLVGYSAAGLPLYSSQHHTSPARPNWFKPVLSQIMENSDSRRIFYFLILNLVRMCNRSCDLLALLLSPPLLQPLLLLFTSTAPLPLSSTSTAPLPLSSSSSLLHFYCPSSSFSLA